MSSTDRRTVRRTDGQGESPPTSLGRGIKIRNQIMSWQESVKGTAVAWKGWAVLCMWYCFRVCQSLFVSTTREAIAFLLRICHWYSWYALVSSNNMSFYTDISAVSWQCRQRYVTCHQQCWHDYQSGFCANTPLQKPFMTGESFHDDAGHDMETLSALLALCEGNHQWFWQTAQSPVVWFAMTLTVVLQYTITMSQDVYKRFCCDPNCCRYI